MRTDLRINCLGVTRHNTPSRGGLPIFFVVMRAGAILHALQAAVGEALRGFTPQECMNYFAASGYEAV